MKKTEKCKGKIDTSVEGYAYLGIHISQEQLSDLASINLMMQKGGALEDIHVHAIILVLKTLGLIPVKTVSTISDNQSPNDSHDYFDNLCQRKFGRRLD